MRDAYQEQLDRLGNGLADMCNLVAEALDNATRALLRADLRLAEQVITDDARIDDLRTAAEEQAFTLLVLQAPVATDLRIVVSGLHAAGDIERMGDLALHIAEAARRRHPDLVMPAEVAPYLAEMGRVGSALARKAGEVIRTLDLVRAGQIEADDDAMDDLHRHLFTMLANPTWPHGVGPAVDITLIGRRSCRRARAPGRLRGHRPNAGSRCSLTPAPRWPELATAAGNTPTIGGGGHCGRRCGRDLHPDAAPPVPLAKIRAMLTRALGE